MIPDRFPEKTKTLKKPDSMTDEECSSLDVFSDGINCISKWKMSWRERLHCLCRGYVWLYVVSGQTQPPVSVVAKKTVFVKVDNEKEKI